MTENGQFDDIDDIIVGDHCNEDEWSEEDKTLLGPSQGLIKVANHVLKEALKTTIKNGKCDTAKQISQYDDLADHVKKLSPAVDQLGIALYPPMGHRFVRAYVSIIIFLICKEFVCMYVRTYIRSGTGMTV